LLQSLYKQIPSVSFLYFFIILIASFNVNAQDVIYQHFGVDEGLPSSEVYDIYQDKNGYIWFATDKGISRYNGYEFENFDTSDGLTGNVVLHFYPQPNGQIWCYTFHNKSLFFFNEDFKGFENYKYNTILKNNLKESSVLKSLHLDESDNLHVGSYGINGKIIIKNDGNVIRKRARNNQDYTPTKIVFDEEVANSFFFTSNNDTISENLSYSIRSTSSNLMAYRWKGNNTEAIFMDYMNVVVKNRFDKETLIENTHRPLVIKPLDYPYFFIGYDFDGGKIVDTKGRIIKTFFKNKSITNFLKDHEGSYWFTTKNSGVYYIKKSSVSVLKHSNQNYKTNNINSLVKTNDNTLFIGYKNGIVAKRTINEGLKIIDIPKTKSSALVEYDVTSKNIILYNDAKVRSLSLNKDIISSYTLKLSEPINETIFLSEPNGFYEVNENKSTYKYYKSPYRIQDVSYWKDDIVIATPSGVFLSLNNSFKPLAEHSKLLQFRSDDIDLSKDRSKLFIATQGAGIVIYGDRIFNITKKDGLSSNIVKEIYIEDNNTIWACTNNGLDRISFMDNDFSITNINKQKGLLSNEVIDVEIVNDTVWAGTKQGLCYFPKHIMDKKPLETPFFKLKKVLVNNVLKHNQEASCMLKLKYNENKIDIITEGISYTNNNVITYAYRLNEEDWSYTKNRTISFSSLSPGSYNFEVKMCTDESRCGDEVLEYHFIITPPFWQRWWFYTLLALLLVGLVYTFIKINVLTYSKDITRELIRLIVKRLKRKEKYISFKDRGAEIKINTNSILFVKSSGNYIDIKTDDKMHTIRMNIGKFLENVPDRLEYLRVHRSYIVRIDKITKKSKSGLLINDIKIPVSQSYHKNLKKILF
jgi:ligand-binding sensor domain-containing protein